MITQMTRQQFVDQNIIISSHTIKSGKLCNDERNKNVHSYIDINDNGTLDRTVFRSNIAAIADATEPCIDFQGLKSAFDSIKTEVLTQDDIGDIEVTYPRGELSTSLFNALIGHDSKDFSYTESPDEVGSCMKSHMSKVAPQLVALPAMQEKVKSGEIKWALTNNKEVILYMPKENSNGPIAMMES